MGVGSGEVKQSCSHKAKMHWFGESLGLRFVLLFYRAASLKKCPGACYVSTREEFEGE